MRTKRRSNPSRFTLAPAQHQTIITVANGLPPRTLQISTQTGFVSVSLINKAIDAALAEVQAA
jgi:hypothetical protein